MAAWLFSLYRRSVLEHPAGALMAVLALALILASQIRGFEIEATADTLILENDSELALFREVGARYRSDDFLIVAYQPHAALLDDATLADIDALQRRLQALAGVASVVTLLDVPLLASPPLTPSELSSGAVNTLRDAGVDRRQAYDELTTSPVYRDLLVSADGRTTALQINLQRDPAHLQLLDEYDRLRSDVETGAEAREPGSADFRLAEVEERLRSHDAELGRRSEQLVAEVRGVIEPYRDRAEIFLGGVPMIAVDMVDFIKSDLFVFGGVVAVFLVVLLAGIFRDWVWVALPLAACALTVASMLGLLAWLDWRLTVVSSNLVALLLIATLSVCIHLAVRYRELQRDQPELDQPGLVERTMASMIKPCLYTTATTMAAFAVLAVSGIRPMMDFGWMMAIGAAVALLMALVMVPAGLLLLPRPAPDRSPASAGLTPRLAMFVRRRGNLVLVAAGLLLVASLWGMSRLQVEHRFIDYFHESTEIHRSMDVIDRQLGGTLPFDVVIDAPAEAAAIDPLEDLSGEEDPFGAALDDPFAEPDGSGASSTWFTSAGMRRLQRVHDYLEQLPGTGKVLSLATLHEALRPLLGGSIDDIELALIERQMPEAIRKVMLEPYFDAGSGQARLAVRVSETSGELQRDRLLTQIRHDLSGSLDLEPGQAQLTGMLVLYNNMLQSLFQSQLLSVSAASLIIVAMLLALFRSLPLALLAVAPNILAAGAVLGGMGLAGLPLDIMTMAIAAIVVGIGVDGSIHYLHRFRAEFARDRNYRAAVQRCHGSVGRAVFYTSIIIIFGFGILVLSSFNPSIHFGALTALAMLAALAGALLLLPQLLIILQPLGAEAPLRHSAADRGADSDPA